MKMKTYDNLEKIKRIYHMSYILIALYHGLSSLSDIAVKYTLKDYVGGSPHIMSIIRSMDKIPFAIQPILGFMTDFCFLFGYRRKMYIFIAAFINMTSLVIMSFTYTTILSLGILVFSLKLGVSLCASIGHAFTVELKNIEEFEKLEKAKELVSDYFLFKFIGEFITSFLKWYLIEITSPHSVFLISSILPIILIVAGFVYDEKKINEEINSNLNIHDCEDFNNLINYHRGKETSHIPDPLGYKGDEIKEINSPILIQQRNYHYPYSLNFSGSLKKIRNVFSNKNYLVPIFFLFFYKTTPTFEESNFFFFTNILKFAPKHLGYVEILSTFMSIIAVSSYKLHFKKYSVKTIFTILTIMNFLMTGIYIILYFRINKKLGIPDIVLILIADPFNNFVMKLIIIPIISVGCALSPRDVESSVYASFYSALNLGNFLGDLFSSLISKTFNIQQLQFNNLHWVILSCRLYSLIPLIAIHLIDPKYFKPKDDVIDEENNSKYNQEYVNETPDNSIKCNQDRRFSRIN